MPSFRRAAPLIARTTFASFPQQVDGEMQHCCVIEKG
jgi:hypothetical protein